MYDKSIIIESVDSLCRDGAGAQYMHYLSKSHITLPQICLKHLLGSEILMYWPKSLVEDRYTQKCAVTKV